MSRRYYECLVLGSILPPLTYFSEDVLDCGMLVRASLRKKEVFAVVVREVEKPSFECLQAGGVEGFGFSQLHLQTARFIADYYLCSYGEALGLFEPVSNSPLPALCEPVCTAIALSNEQMQALEFLRLNAVSALFGATGSGKTEVYMKLIEETLLDEKTAILLMPEISLTPQIEKRLREHFGESVALWHSRQNAKKKKEVLQAIHDGSVRLVAGPRSALFLPMRNLGVIVVDEEHDDAYKSSSRPRYNAKDLAIYLGGKFGAKVVLGSATPSLQTFAKFPYFRLKNSYFSGEKLFVFEESEPILSEFIVTEIEKTLLDKSAQAIIFLPTRANYKYLICQSCKKSVECPYCSVGMSLHRGAKALKCHYCGYAQTIPTTCPHCGEERLKSFRIGTSEVCETLRQRFGDKRIEKFDRDAITTETKLRQVLKEFNDGEIDILVGTQMLSKGHDYHGIKLAVVIGLDSVLAQNDFRAKERALALLIQISGRAGRNGASKVIVQTQQKEFFMRYVDDYELFLQDEMRARVGLYPPHVRLARLLFSDKNQQKAADAMQKTVEQLRGHDVEIVGFGEAAVSRIAGKYRYDILLRSPSARQLLTAIHALGSGSFEVDIDPLSFS